MGLERIARPRKLDDVFAFDRTHIESHMTEASRAVVMAFLTSFYRVSAGQRL